MNSSSENCRSEKQSSSASIPIPLWKRGLDFALVIVAAPVLLPGMALIALLIRAVSSGPILFKQERVGYKGRRFVCLKFRTMFVDADTSVHQDHLHQLMSSDGPMVKMDSHGDLRLIPFGLQLRSCGLDELPQIFNILRGEMSFVGPRPCLPYEYQKYTHWQQARFDTVPGLTGLWQVSGKNRTTFTEMVQLDIKYAKTKSLWLDLKIVLKTVPAILVQIQDIRKRKKSAPLGDQSGTSAPAEAAARQAGSPRPNPLTIRSEGTKS